MHWAKYAAEFIGTCVFLTIILKSGGNKYVIALGLLAALLFMESVSGGHFNPAVSFMMYVKDQLSGQDLAGYIIAQLLGAIAAIFLARL